MLSSWSALVHAEQQLELPRETRRRHSRGAGGGGRPGCVGWGLELELARVVEGFRGGVAAGESNRRLARV
jgi:hypothetical protein